MAARSAAAKSSVSIDTIWRAEERRKIFISFALVAPLFVFMSFSLLAPMGFVLLNSIDNSELAGILPKTSARLARWDPSTPLQEEDYAAIHDDLIGAQKDRKVSRVGQRLNAAVPGFQAVVSRTARELAARTGLPATSFKDRLLALDPMWGDQKTWRVLRRSLSTTTSAYFLSAFDLILNEDGKLQQTPEDRRIFRNVWLRTVAISGLITVVCALIGYPVAYAIAIAPPRVASIALAFVLLPFWTSLLVRTTAWVALLQTEGILNRFLATLGVVNESVQLIHNRAGVYIAMAQILLPYMILPLYGVMTRIPQNMTRASLSLGATPMRTFAHVYLPLSLPGLGAGSVLVFILAVGFYVTPALVGGASDQMISYYIYYYTNESLNWNFAAALSVLLFVFTTIVFAGLVRGFGLARIAVR